MRPFFRAAALCFLLAAAPVSAGAEEGMWTFDNFPAAAVKAKYGATIDQAWLDHVRASAVRLAGGCSASVVSGQGLVLTNHHCVSDCVQSLSTRERDYVRFGYGVAAKVDERLCPGMQAEILEKIEDVTARVDRRAGGGAGGFARARDAEIAAIEKEGCAGREATHRCQVITLYQGGQYKLYTYRRYADVRLVFAPEFATAFFGGDPDNFNFPRYDADFSFLRLYDGGRPASTPEHLTWSTAAPKAGELVFVAGNPGTTERLLTADQLRSLRDFALPKALIQFSELRGRYTRFAQESPERERIVNGDLFGIENSLKAWRGQFQTLSGDAFIAAKAKADAALKARAMADRTLSASIGDPWAEIARAQEARAALYDSYGLLESRAGGGSDLYYSARTLVRAAQERARPNAERMREYADARLALMEKGLVDTQPVEPEVEQLKLEFWLTKVREYLTADAPATKAILGTSSPETLARRLSTSRLGEAAVRKALWEGGLPAIQASTDPMILHVLATDRIAREVRRDYEARVSGPTDRASQAIARARFAIYGTSTYPDATFSLRLSYGTVEGWTYQGATVAPFTYLRGLYERATGQEPYALAPSWLAGKARLDLDTVFDISTSNDIIGGNSGSPLINARAEVVGAIFDGNIHSLGGDYGYDGAVNRAVSVSTAAITEALLKIYDKPEIVRELTAR